MQQGMQQGRSQQVNQGIAENTYLDTLKEAQRKEQARLKLAKAMESVPEDEAGFDQWLRSNMGLFNDMGVMDNVMEYLFGGVEAKRRHASTMAEIEARKEAKASRVINVAGKLVRINADGTIEELSKLSEGELHETLSKDPMYQAMTEEEQVEARGKLRAMYGDYGEPEVVPEVSAPTPVTMGLDPEDTRRLIIAGLPSEFTVDEGTTVEQLREQILTGLPGAGDALGRALPTPGSWDQPFHPPFLQPEEPEEAKKLEWLRNLPGQIVNPTLDALDPRNWGK